MKILLAALFALFLQDWVESLDVPLPQGFQEEEEARVIFDAPGGRMLEMLWVGEETPTQVAAFYRVSLPQLGWHEKDEEVQGESLILDFEREGERLTLDVQAGSRGTLLYITLTPSS